MSTPNEGAKYCKEAREALGLTPEELADLIGVAPQTVWRWERDPVQYPNSARPLPDFARKVIGWMLAPGRPKGWPKAPRKEN